MKKALKGGRHQNIFFTHFGLNSAPDEDISALLKMKSAPIKKNTGKDIIFNISYNNNILFCDKLKYFLKLLAFSILKLKFFIRHHIFTSLRRNFVSH